MKEYFVLSDIHSFYNEMIAALDKQGFDINNKDHIIIVCGDLLDRGPDSLKVVDFFYKLLNSQRAILIRGNHEDLFDDMISTGQFSYCDVQNGTIKTLGQLLNPPKSATATTLLFEELYDKYDKRWDFLKSKMVDYCELGKYIFVHGWIPTKDDYDLDNTLGVMYDPEWRDASPERWADARWLNGMKYAFNGIIEKSKIIICGHWHTSYAHSIIKQNKTGKRCDEFGDDANFSIFYGDGIIALDACTAHTGFCNCLHLTESDLYETKSSNS